MDVSARNLLALVGLSFATYLIGIFFVIQRLT